MADAHDAGRRLVAKVLRDVVGSARFEDHQALMTALRRKLDGLRIRYRQCDLDDAVNLVETNRTLVFDNPVAATAAVQPEHHTFVVSRAEAARILEAVKARVGTLPAPKVFP